METFDEWTQVDESISTKDLDEAAQLFWDAKQKYEEQKEHLKQFEAAYKEQMRKLQTLMDAAGKSTWDTDFGKAIMAHRMQYTTPKTVEDKQAFAKWIQETHGKEFFWSIFGVNSQTLNGFLKKELEANPELDFPGIDAPTANSYIQFRRKK